MHRIGIRLDETSTFLSILLETQDVSTRVKVIPSTTRPKLVSFLLKNSELDYDTVGIKINKFHDNTQDYIALSNEIERTERNYPLVLVSNNHEVAPLINPVRLQDHLLGLAQVVCTDDDIDSWEMERNLTKPYSAWGGAINIVFPNFNRNFCPTHLILNSEINSLKENGVNINHHILSIITHKTNAYNKRKHFTPIDVRSKRQIDYQYYLREKFSNHIEDNDFKSLAEEAFSQLEEQSTVIENIHEDYRKQILELEDMYLNIQDQLDKSEQNSSRKDYKIKDLQGLLQQLSNNYKIENHEEDISKEEMINYIAIDISPEQCLKVISSYIPERIIVLESAMKSAKEMERFKNGRNLILKLWRLGNDYLDTILEHGDSKAKEIFGKAYSAKESETLINNKKLSSLRTFEYNGEKIEMQRHLKIGVAQNTEQTLRVYFHIDNHSKKIVIGYCGEHLPISSL